MNFLPIVSAGDKIEVNLARYQSDTSWYIEDDKCEVTGVEADGGRGDHHLVHQGDREAHQPDSNYGRYHAFRPYTIIQN